MKKLICLAALSLGVAAGADAQKNSVLLFGDAGFSNNKTPSDDVTKSLDFNLGLGYQFDRNWTAGITGGYGTVRNRPDGQTYWNLNDMYNIAPFVRYTQPVGSLFYVFVQAEAGYQGTASGRSDQNNRFNHNGVYAYAFPAVGVNIKNGWALNFGVGGLGYSSMKAEAPASSNPDNTFNINFGQQFHAGISWNIACQSKKGNFKKHHNREKDDEGYDSWKRDRKDRKDRRSR